MKKEMDWLDKGQPYVLPLLQGKHFIHTIPKERLSYMLDNLCTGRLPKQILVSFVRHDAFNGSLKKNDSPRDQEKGTREKNLLNILNILPEVPEVRFSSNHFYYVFCIFFMKSFNSIIIWYVLNAFMPGLSNDYIEKLMYKLSVNLQKLKGVKPCDIFLNEIHYGYSQESNVKKISNF